MRIFVSYSSGNQFLRKTKQRPYKTLFLQLHCDLLSRWSYFKASTNEHRKFKNKNKNNKKNKEKRLNCDYFDHRSWSNIDLFFPQ